MKILAKSTILALLAAACGFYASPGWAAMPKSYGHAFFEEEDDYFELQSSLRRQATAEDHVSSKNFAAEEAALFSAAQTPQNVQSAPDPEPDSEPIYRWFVQNQAANASGLIVSHPDDTGFVYHDGIQQDWAKIHSDTQGYTYDQALAGITLLKQGDMAGAKKIFDFFASQAEGEGEGFSGFWTVYNVDPSLAWKKYEWRKGMGESAWIALFALQYETANKGTIEGEKALQLAAKIARWIGTLPGNQHGAAAMSPANAASFPDFGTLYSVENNLDYYVLLKTLKDKAPDLNDRQAFSSRFDSLKTWLKTEAYDPAQGMFKRGGQYVSGTGQFFWDTTKSLDVNSWAISAVGIPALAGDFGIDIHAFVTRIQDVFAVQDDGTFGGDILGAKGFDFSDAANAGALGRRGLKWVEGTNHMVLDYQLLASHYKTSDPEKAAHYRELADYFQGRNVENAIAGEGALSYAYADVFDVQIFEGTPTWKTSSGQTASSAAWVYFSLAEINPFEAAPAATLPSGASPFSVSVSTTSLGNMDLGIEVGEDLKATIHFNNQVYQGIFDEITQTIQLDGVQTSPSAPSESWLLGFGPGFSGNEMSLSSFDRRLTGADGWLYAYGYDFTLEGLLDSDRSEESFGGHRVSRMTVYEYTVVGGGLRLASAQSATLLDGAYSLGQETAYEYSLDAEGALTTMFTVTQETRNIPFFRTLISYRMAFHPDGRVDVESLGAQNIPL